MRRELAALLALALLTPNAALLAYAVPKDVFPLCSHELRTGRLAVIRNVFTETAYANGYVFGTA